MDGGTLIVRLCVRLAAGAVGRVFRRVGAAGAGCGARAGRGHRRQGQPRWPPGSACSPSRRRRGPS